MAKEEKVIYRSENDYLELALLSVLGDREEQQDQTGYILKERNGFVVVCDGMGGHAEGGKASAIVTEHMLKEYSNEYPWDEPTEGMIKAVCQADHEVSSLCDEEGTRIQAGTTLSAIAIQDKALNWVSVGDSRIYIHRKDELIQVTTDHIYQMVLDKAIRQQTITEEEYQKEMPKGKRLVSFIGKGDIPYLDSNKKPFPLCSGDQILLITDGLYKILSGQEILRILGNGRALTQILSEFEEKTEVKARENKINRDNMTIVLVEIKEETSHDADQM